MTVPLILRIGALVVATTAFYAYVGQMVPQKEVQPPKETAMGSDMTTADMVKVGREIMEGKGLCVTCHTIGKTGALRFPDLGGIGALAKNRVPGLSDVEYLAQSMYEPTAFVVPGFPPAMPPVNGPPIGLTHQEILSVIAALQTLGGTPTVTMKTTHRYYDGTAAPSVAPPAAAPAPNAQPEEAQPLAAPKPGALLTPEHELRARPARAAGQPRRLPGPAGASAKAGAERGVRAHANDGVGGPSDAKPHGPDGGVAR